MASRVQKTRVARELKRAGALCLAFANTGVPRRDDRRRSGTAPPAMPLESYDELATWGARLGALDATAGERLRQVATERSVDAAAAVARAVRLRSAIERVATGRVLGREPRASDVAIVTELLRLRLPVATEGGFRWDWAGDAGALERPLWPIAQSAAELLVAGDLDKVRQCGTRGCYQLFLAGRHPRLWCDANTCGSRARGKRYRDWKRRLSKSKPGQSVAQKLEEIRRYKRERLEREQRERRPVVEDRDAGDAERQP